MRPDLERRHAKVGYRYGAYSDVVTQAVRRLKEEQFWETVHERINAMTDVELADYQAETSRLDGTAADGLIAT